MQMTFKGMETCADGYEFGGFLTITAQDSREVMKLIDHFRLFRGDDVETLQAKIDVINSGDFSHTIGKAKRPVYLVESCLDYEFSLPYVDFMLDKFGYDGQLPEIDIPLKWEGLNYTTYDEEIYISNGHICFKSYTTSQPWNGKDAQDYAESRVKDTLGERFGTRHLEPEFIGLSNGQYKRNPNYLKRHKSRPSASNVELINALTEWWGNNNR